MPQNLLLILLLTPVAALVQAADAGWGDPLRDESDIRVYTREVDGSSYRAFRAEVLLPAGMASVLALLNDFPACVDWLYLCKSGRQLEERDFRHYYFYQASDMPFPVKDRDYVLLGSLSMHEDGQGVRVLLESQPDFIPETGDIRIREISGFYDLTETEPESAGSMVQLVWEQHVDPAGNIPGWLMNLLLVEIPFNSMVAFRELVQKPEYSGARLRRDADGQITGFAE